MALIQQFAEDEKLETEKRRAAAEENEGGFTCTICYMGFEEGVPVPLTDCVHIFHRECLEDYTNNSISELKADIICPEAGCGKKMTQYDLKQVLPAERFKKFTDFILD